MRLRTDLRLVMQQFRRREGDKEDSCSSKSGGCGLDRELPFLAATPGANARSSPADWWLKAYRPETILM